MTSAAQFTKWHRFRESVGKAVLGATILLRQGKAEPSDLRYLKDFLQNARILELLTADIPVFHIGSISTTSKEWGPFVETYGVMVEQLGEIPYAFDRFIIEVECGSLTHFYVYEKIDKTTYNTSIFYFDPSLPLSASYMIVGSHDPVPLISEWGMQLHTYPEGDQVEVYLAWAAMSRIAFEKLIVLLSTRGIEQQRIPGPVFLNKQRVKKGKIPIPDVILIKVGHYYDQNGSRIEYDERKPVRIHHRRGHTRGVWCGSGDDRHLEQRYIFPCLVNFKPGDAVPAQPLRVLQ